MSLDRRVYLATALAALVAGGAVFAAAPHDAFTATMTVHTEDGVPSTPAYPMDGDDAVQPESVAAAPTAHHGRHGLQIVDGAEGGMGVRAPAPAIWPVDLRREMSTSEPVVGMLR